MFERLFSLSMTNAAVCNSLTQQGLLIYMGLKLHVTGIKNVDAYDKR